MLVGVLVYQGYLLRRDRRSGVVVDVNYLEGPVH